MNTSEHFTPTMSGQQNRSPSSKEELRERIAADVEAFLAEGGVIQQVAPGKTGMTKKKLRGAALSLPGTPDKF